MDNICGYSSKRKWRMRKETPVPVPYSHATKCSIRSCKGMEAAKPQSSILPALDSPRTTSPKLSFFSNVRIRMELRLGHSSRPWVKIAVRCS